MFQLQSFAQKQVGVFVGVANYNGDLVEKLYKSTEAAIGFNFGYQITSRINLKAGLDIRKSWRCRQS
jgi:hypothetical protein